MRCESVHLLEVALILIAALPTNAEPTAKRAESLGARFKRSSYHVVKDCLMVTSEEGQFFYKSTSDEETVCGVYLLTDPDRYVEVHFDYLDVPCQKGGLVSFIDGWEMNRQFFPSPEDHPKPMSERFKEFCGQRKIKPVFVSSQNAALIQYRIPTRGRGFSFTVKYPRNPTPCNILLEGTMDVYTLRNYGKRVNCTLTAVYAASVTVLSLNVGLASSGRIFELETGTIHKCEKRGLPDFVQVGGSTGLDTAHMLTAASICGMDSKPGSTLETIFCEVSSVRLVSNGEFDNSVTVAVRQATVDDLLPSSLFCPMAVDGLGEA